jgi:hypothetical protein
MRERAFLLVAVLATPACVDPGGDFHDFVKRLGPPKAVDAGPDATRSCVVAPGSISGDYLFTLSAAIARTKPLVFLTTLSTPPLNGGTGLTFSAQPLSAADRTTPVGTPITLGPFPVDATGSFTASIPGLTVTGAANSVTPGSGIAADVTLTGNLCGDGSFFCGTASGMVTQPINVNLAGSTFTLTRLDAAHTIPAQPKLDCAGNLADPI